MSIEIKFCGAAGVVTGSCYLLSVPGGKFLIDCGMFQGTKTVAALNYGDFSFDPAELSFVLLTHAHIDHSGLLPKLYRYGFTGAIYATEPTKDLLAHMLPDSAAIQESEVLRLNKRNAQRGLAEVTPIYTSEHVDECLASIKTVEINGWIDLPLGVKARYWNAGHILGSASIEVKAEGAHILFSGDLGPDNKMFHAAPESPHNIDYLVVESTYGNRKREDTGIEARRGHLQEEILEAVEARGNILIPAFAVERTQELLLDIDWLVENNRIPALPLFIDSPLATKVTQVFERYCDEIGDMCGAKSPFRGRNIRYTESVEDSKNLSRIKGGAIIMAGSGMCDAGRIRHHLKNNLWNPATTVLFVGYQAEGTLGHFLRNGQKKVRIHGEEIDVRARIRSIDTYSAHADRDELIAWVKARLPVRKNIFLTHGSDESRVDMARALGAAGVDEKIILRPFIDEEFQLDTAAAARKEGAPVRLTTDEMKVSDWHNDYARFVLDLAQFLREMKDSNARRTLLADLFRHIRKNGKNGGS